jgi:ankyrin repeat protein
MAYEEAPNDLDELFIKCTDLSAADPAFFLKMSMGRLSLNDVKEMVSRMGKAVIQIGDGLTLLHLAAQNGCLDIVEYLVEDMKHPLEVKYL